MVCPGLALYQGLMLLPARASVASSQGILLATLSGPPLLLSSSLSCSSQIFPPSSINVSPVSPPSLLPSLSLAFPPLGEGLLEADLVRFYGQNTQHGAWHGVDI